MRTEILRLYKSIHTWTGIVTGLALFIAFYAGAITMFKEPLARWITPPGPVSLTAIAQVDDLIAQTVTARPDARKEFTLHLGEEENVAARLTWQKNRTDPAPWSSTLAPDGTVQVARLHPSGLAHFIDDIHRTAGIPLDREHATAIMGVVSALYVVALVSGVILLLPSLVKDFFALRIGSNLKRMWLDAHNVIGIISLPFHIAIALTAVVFGMHDLIYDTQDRVVYEGRLKSMMKAGSPFGPAPGDNRPAPMLSAAELLDRVRQVSPEFEPRTMQYRNAGTSKADVRVSGDDPRHMIRGKGFVMISAVTGDILNTEYFPGHQGGWSATVSSFFAVHFGSYGGNTVRWSYFFLGLSGAFLFYSGNLLWVETRRRKARRGDDEPVTQTRSTRLMAAGTVGVCLGCICGISLTIVMGKWLNGHVADLNAWHKGIYYAVFLGSIAWSFLRGAAKGAVELLWLAATATAAIPLTTLLAWGMPSLGLWAHGSAGTLGVDLVAFVGSLCFARAACVTRNRVRKGPVDSVWAEPDLLPAKAC